VVWVVGMCCVIVAPSEFLKVLGGTLICVTPPWMAFVVCIGTGGIMFVETGWNTIACGSPREAVTEGPADADTASPAGMVMYTGSPVVTLGPVAYVTSPMVPGAAYSVAGAVMYTGSAVVIVGGSICVAVCGAP